MSNPQIRFFSMRLSIKFFLPLSLGMVFLICSKNFWTDFNFISTNATKGNGDYIAHENHSSYYSTPSNTILNRFSPPDGFQRIKVSENSFAHYLRMLPLKPDGSLVQYYDGEKKTNQSVYEAVVNLPIGTKNLHQCADAIIRLKADYHWNKQEFEKIHFNLTNGDRIDYAKWMAGNRLVVKGNKTNWVKKKLPSNTSKDFWQYLELIFTYAGTASLSRELNTVDIQKMKIGDIFIQGGHPGHAVLIVDMAIDPNTQERLFLLGQSYMPAQEFQILKNNNDASISPWYRLTDTAVIETPEWTFNKNQLKRFAD